MAVDYRRRISSEEAREGYILIEKARLTFFPRVGETFRFDDRGAAREATVESYHCECRGPDKPHEHYFIRTAGLTAGEEWKITRDTAGYRLLPA
jgi:hypothetical protein